MKSPVRNPLVKRRVPFSFAVGLAALLNWTAPSIRSASAEPDPQPSELSVHARSLSEKSLTLTGRDSRQQVLVTGKVPTGALVDLTRRVEYSSTPKGVIEVSATGLISPMADGTATLQAKTASGLTGSLEVHVEQAGRVRPMNFANQIVPIFTKAGCNAGGCHGKSSGQNGFKLSLLGFEPSDDYEFLVREARGRRLFPAAPDRSLLLLKGTATLPHGGGKRIEKDSDDYETLRQWIAQGMPRGDANDPSVARIEVVPPARTLGTRQDQQLVVLAHYTDGAVADVTRASLYEANDKDLAAVDGVGHVETMALPGSVAVMVRYQSKVAVFQATIPLGAPMGSLPAPKNFIDERVFQKLKAMGLPPSDLCDDATFLRRVTLDIAGRLPTFEETTKFVASQDKAKRESRIDELLASAEYAENFASQWNSLLRNKRGAPTHIRGNFAFFNWIRDSFADNKPYDQFVREVVAASGDMADNPPVAWFRQVNNPSAQLEDTAQLFLGLRLQCAQCHHHPFEKWSQQDYYALSAAFSQVGRKPGARPGEEVIFHKRGQAAATHKKTKQSVKPAFLGSKALDLSPDDDPRLALANWMAAPKNPFFARALVNRYWKHFFNRGLVEPDDDMRETNPPVNPELLDDLAKNFIETKFDLKKLVKTICSSQTYQLSSIPNEYNAVDKQNFSRYYPRRLTAEVLLDAVNDTLGARNRFDGLPASTRAVQLPDNSFNANSYFLSVFGRPDSASACECERSQDASLAQSLHLLNAKDIQDKLADNNGRAAQIAKDTSQSDSLKMRELYQRFFSRPPERSELDLALKHLNKPGKDGAVKPEEKRQRYEDLLWALLNTKEFLFNH